MMIDRLVAVRGRGVVVSCANEQDTAATLRRVKHSDVRIAKFIESSPTWLMLAFDKYGAAGAGDPQDGTTAVDGSFGDHLAAFDAHRYSGKFGYDSADIAGQFVLRPDRHTQIRRDDDRNVTASGGKERIGHGLARQQAGDDAADGGRDAHTAGNVVEVHAAAGVFAAHAF